MVLTKHNPELKKISMEIVNEINSLNFQIEKLTNQPFPIICDIFLKLSNHLATVESYFFDWLKSSEENSLEWIIAFLSYEIVFEPIFGPMILFVIYGWDIFQCSG
jgi:hypothetical protein